MILYKFNENWESITIDQDGNYNANSLKRFIRLNNGEYVTFYTEGTYIPFYDVEPILSRFCANFNYVVNLLNHCPRITDLDYETFQFNLEKDLQEKKSKKRAFNAITVENDDDIDFDF